MARKKDYNEQVKFIDDKIPIIKDIDKERLWIKINAYIIMFGYLLGLAIIIYSLFSHADLRDRILFLMLGFLIMMRASQIDQSDDLRTIMFQNKVTNQYVNYRLRKDEEEKE